MYSREWLICECCQFWQTWGVVSLLLATVICEHLVHKVAEHTVCLLTDILFGVWREVLRMFILQDHVGCPWRIEGIIGIVRV